MSSTLEREWEPFSPCPCGCAVVSGKLSVRFGHVRNCACPSCRGRRNKRKGSAANSRAHRRLGGVGIMVNDDLFHAYSLNHSLEVKTGAQLPAKLLEGLRSEWSRTAFRQAEKKVPVGSDALPTICLEVGPSEAYLLTDVSGRALRG